MKSYWKDELYKFCAINETTASSISAPQSWGLPFEVESSGETGETGKAEPVEDKSAETEPVGGVELAGGVVGEVEPDAEIGPGLIIGVSVITKVNHKENSKMSAGNDCEGTVY
ncbi:unnamed protein product [Rhizophagus irregularis]|nr:unnamed protein product [Rhizophagus irregularis]CAB4445595.1 unnamed protein product [Rhizophagus irregularis]